jgi:toxin ParE1/3/4
MRGIASYTTEKWGEDQAVRYISDLRECMALLAGKPSMGRACNPLIPDLRRHEHGKHVIFYIPQPDGILIARILHQQMIPSEILFNL